METGNVKGFWVLILYKFYNKEPLDKSPPPCYTTHNLTKGNQRRKKTPRKGEAPVMNRYTVRIMMNMEAMCMCAMCMTRYAFSADEPSFGETETL